MIVMFGLGGGSLGWMIGVGALMGAERSTRWGRVLTRPVGVALVVWAAVDVVMLARPIALA
jgi:predicted metal-binding membrane protein